jgi:hypothetical protein
MPRGDSFTGLSSRRCEPRVAMKSEIRVEDTGSRLIADEASDPVRSALSRQKSDHWKTFICYAAHMCRSFSESANLWPL